MGIRQQLVRARLPRGEEFSELFRQLGGNVRVQVSDDDPRLEKLYLAVLGAHEDSEEGDFRRVARYELEYIHELFKLKQ